MGNLGWVAASAAMDVGESLRMLTQPPAPPLANRRRKRRPWLLSLLLPLLSAGVPAPASAAGNEAGNRFPVDGRVALFEPDIELSELAGGKTLPRPEWTATARLLYAQAALEMLDQRGISVVPGSTVSPADVSGDDGLRQQVRSIAAALLQRRQGVPPTLSLEIDPATLQRIAVADYGLFTWIRDSQAGNGRTAMRLAGKLLIGNLRSGERAGVAMLVELRTGKVVWHALLPGQTYDLRNLAGARDAAARLLNPLQAGQPASAGAP